MKPRDITGENDWDIDIAVLELGDVEVRVWCGGQRIEIGMFSKESRIRVSLPVETWKMIVDFADLDHFSDKNPAETNQVGILIDGYEVIIYEGVQLVIINDPKTHVWEIIFDMQDFREIIDWYNADAR